jgi:non-heme chloroperoxidase
MSVETLDLEILGVRPPDGVSPHATPLVFLHGAFAGAWCWAEHFLPAFAARGYTCLAPSFRGHGGSDGRDRLSRATIADYVADLASVVEGLERPPVLIGHSMGGFVAMKYAERAPVAGLALFAAVPPAGLMGASLSLALFKPTLLAEIGMAQSGRPDALSWEGLRQALFSDSVPKALVQRYLPMMGPESPAAVADMHGRVTADPSRIRGRMPVLVAGARRDSLVPAAYVRSTARQLGVQAALLDGIGHGLMLDENWPLAAALLAEWLAAHDI